MLFVVFWGEVICIRVPVDYTEIVCLLWPSRVSGSAQLDPRRWKWGLSNTLCMKVDIENQSTALRCSSDAGARTWAPLPWIAWIGQTLKALWYFVTKRALTQRGQTRDLWGPLTRTLASDPCVVPWPVARRAWRLLDLCCCFYYFQTEFSVLSLSL